MTRQKARDPQFDNIKAVLIILTVFCHTMELYKSDYLLSGFFYTFVYSFHMPAFVFISGYFSKNAERSRRNAFSSLLFPFLIFHFGWYLVTLAGFAIQEAFHTGWGIIPESPLAPSWAMWYLFCLFFWRCSIRLFSRLRASFLISLAVAAGLCAGCFPEIGMVLALSRFLVYTPFFLMGYFCTEKHIARFRAIPAVLYPVIICFVLALSWIFAGQQTVPIAFLYGDHAYAYFALGPAAGILFRSCWYFSACALIPCLFRIIPNRQLPFAKIGSGTLCIYLLHPYLLWVCNIPLLFLSGECISLIFSLLSTILILTLLTRPAAGLLYQRIIARACSILSRRLFQPLLKETPQKCLPAPFLQKKSAKSKIYTTKA